jgi:hypothetical protein
MKKGDLFKDAGDTVLEFVKYDEDGTPCFITNDNKTDYALLDGYIIFSREYVDSEFDRIRIEAPPVFIPDYRSIKVNYIRPTVSKPARVRLTDMENGQTVVIPHEEESYLNDGGVYLNRRGIRIVGRSRIKGGYILSVDTFDVPIV